MGNSLTDQLLKAGLANKKQLNKAKQEQRQTSKKQRKGKKAKPVISESKQAAQKAIAKESERNRLLNLKHRQEQKNKEIEAQIGQLITSNEVSLEDGGSPYNFVDGTKIMKIYVTKSIREQLSNGTLVIVDHQKQYHVVSAETAEKIHQRNQETPIFKNEPKKKSDDEYDPYEEFPVPDDIDW
ncbi:MAG: DUF2058 domain-containing protein [Desulfobulbaceae bacterium]|nr:DUF2058 domain-containing protein [Desulfobulbaceae bacterium]